MKFATYLLVLVCMLLACRLGAAPEAEIETLEPDIIENEEASQIEPTSAPEQIVESVSPLSPLSTPVTVDLSWEVEAAAPLISATNCCGYTPQIVALNYLAEATVWGDGRFVWVTQQGDGPRQVLQSQLSPQQIEAFLQRAQTEGFFGWDDRYEDTLVADAAEKCLSIALQQQTKQVCEYVQGAPPAFHQLYNEIVAGIDSGNEFVPERGYLQAIKLEAIADTVPIDAEWSAADMGFSLAEVGEGRWIEGAALAQAWSIVNAKWHGMVVKEGETLYQIAVQIPGLSTVTPPPGQ